MDTDSSEVLDQEQLVQFGEHLGIALTATEVALMREEMGGTDEVPYDSFVAWWLSGSKIAAKVKAAKN